MPKLNKDGSVIDDEGTVIGKVERRVPDGLHIRGVSVSLSQAPLWFPYTAEGVCLSQDGERTRKEALRMVEQFAKPLEVTNLKREVGLAGRECVTAWVSWQGNGAGVSRYPHETEWVIDYWHPRGAFFPSWSNGTGTRYNKPYVLKPEQACEVTNMAVAAGLVTE